MGHAVADERADAHNSEGSWQTPQADLDLSHEIRTPLTSILGFSELLLEDGDLPHIGMTRAAAVERIQRNAAQLLRLVDRILETRDLRLDRAQAD